MKVCILAAGAGTRMGRRGDSLHKALLPLGGMAVLSRIFSSFPADSQFVIAVGSRSDQIRDFVAVAHPEMVVEFREVDNFEGPGSGPGYSLLSCRDKLQEPFAFIACDTIVSDQIDWTDQVADWVGLAEIPQQETMNYCNMEVVDGRVHSIRDKVAVSAPGSLAFVGLAYIHDFDAFWTGLANGTKTSGEHQVAAGLEALRQGDGLQGRLVSWTDVGTWQKFEKAARQYEDFDFSKEREAIYISATRVVKFFADADISARRVRKATLNPEVFPRITAARGCFYGYDYVEGDTLYGHMGARTFSSFLSWAQATLWRKADLGTAEMATMCREFYFEKTTARLKQYRSKYPDSTDPTTVNGRAVLDEASILAAIPWSDLESGVPAFIHGDLQFDNVLYQESTGRFVLIDWRQDFAGRLDVGDLYYDFAKLNGGLLLPYDLVKKGLIWYRENDGDATLDFGQHYQGAELRDLLLAFVEAQGMDVWRLELITGIIFLNMAPLHEPPFDRFLHAFGRAHVTRSLNSWRARG